MKILALGSLGSVVLATQDQGGDDKNIGKMNWLCAGVSMVIPNIGGIAGALFTRKAIPEWYNTVIVRPSWRPPNKAFGPVWTFLYTSMGYSSYLVWKALDEPNLLDVAALPRPLQLFALQLGLNWIWTPIFFGAKHLTGALVGILAIDAAVVATTASFLEVDQTAGLLLLPYIGWLSLATALTTSIWINNPDYRWGPPKTDKTD